MFSRRSPSDDALAKVVSGQRGLPFTYAAVGATRGELPSGYHHDRRSVTLGPDEGDRFERASRALARWGPQRGAGLRVYPADPVAEGLTFALVIRLPVAGVMTAAGRVVYVTDTPTEFGFAYGTLPGHPEEGEEAFVVARADGEVRFGIVAFSRPRHVLARLGAPVTRRIQVQVTDRYLEAMRSAAG